MWSARWVVEWKSLLEGEVVSGCGRVTDVDLYNFFRFCYQFMYFCVTWR